MKNEHGPTPWTVKPRLVDAGFEVVADSTGRTVGAVTLREDADFIVEAVNGFNALRAFVGELCDCLEEEDAESYKALVAKAREAIGEGGAE